MSKEDKVKGELLTVTTHLLIERGDTKKVTYRDIAAAAGIPASRLSYYFPHRQDLLRETAAFILENTQVSPLAGFLEKNRGLLSSREGQLFFIDDLLRCFHRYFLGVECVKLNCGLALHVILRSTEYTSEALRKTISPPLRDARAFWDIYYIITGEDDMEQATFLYATTLYALAHRLSISRPLKQAYQDCFFEDDFEIKFIYFCRKQLLIGLGLWEKPVPNADDSAISQRS